MNLRKVPIIVWFAVPTLLIVGLGTWFLSSSSFGENQQDSTKPEQVNVNIEGVEEHEILGRQHMSQGQTGSDYNSNPPTSGMHWGIHGSNGVFDKPIPDEQVIHNLEHGYIWITYKSDTSEDIVNSLKDIVNEDDWKITLSPRDANESQIAIAAWGRSIKLDELDTEKIKAFINAYRNRGPEKTPN